MQLSSAGLSWKHSSGRSTGPSREALIVLVEGVLGVTGQRVKLTTALARPCCLYFRFAQAL